MNVPIQEILMLLGDKVVEVHQRDKEINLLNDKILHLENEIKLKTLQIADLGLER